MTRDNATPLLRPDNTVFIIPFLCNHTVPPDREKIDQLKHGTFMKGVSSLGLALLSVLASFKQFHVEGLYQKPLPSTLPSKELGLMVTPSPSAKCLSFSFPKPNFQSIPT